MMMIGEGKICWKAVHCHLVACMRAFNKMFKISITEAVAGTREVKETLAQIKQKGDL